MKQTSPTLVLEDHNSLKRLRSQIEDLCSDLAAKFNLYDKRGKPRNAFILDTLMRYSCYGCIVKVLTQQRRDDRADKLFLENHRLAIGLLMESLRRRLRDGFKIEEEVKGEYGRPDIVVKSTSMGVILEIANRLEVVVEVKTGEIFTYSQVFRYLIERPNAILILWRVTKRQIIRFDGEKIRKLLLLAMEAALNRGMSILNGEYDECDHTPVKTTPYVIEDSQAIVDDFLTALVDTLPAITKAVLDVVRECFRTVEAA